MTAESTGETAEKDKVNPEAVLPIVVADAVVGQDGNAVVAGQRSKETQKTTDSLVEPVAQLVYGKPILNNRANGENDFVVVDRTDDSGTPGQVPADGQGTGSNEKSDSYTDSKGREVTTKTDGDSFISTTYGAGKKPVLEVAVGPNGKSRTEYDASGAITKFAWDAAGKLTNKDLIAANGDVTKLSYDTTSTDERLLRADHIGVEGFRTSIHYGYNQAGAVKNVDYADSYGRFETVETADGGKSGQLNVFDESDLSEPNGHGFYSNKVSDITVDHSNGSYSYNERSSRATLNADGAMSFVTVLPPEASSTTEAVAQESSSPEEKPWYQRWYDNAYNAVSSMLDGSNGDKPVTDVPVGASVTSTGAKPTTDPLALAFVDDLPSTQWSKWITSAKTDNPDALKAYWKMQEEGSSTANLPPRERDYSAISAMETSGSEVNRQNFDYWYNNADKNVVDAYKEWGAEKQAAELQAQLNGDVAPLSNLSQSNPQQWLADLNPEAVDNYLVSASDAEYGKFMADYTSGKTDRDPPMFNGERDFDYLDKMRYLQEPAEQAKLEYWKNNASPELVSDYEQWTEKMDQRGLEDYDSLFAGLDSKGQDAYLQAMYEHGAKTGDYRQADDFEAWVRGADSERRPLGDSAFMNDFAWTESEAFDSNNYTHLMEHMISKPDGEFDNYSRWLDDKFATAGAAPKGAIRADLPAGRPDEIASQSPPAVTDASDISELIKRFTTATPNYEQMARLVQDLKAENAASGRQPKDLLLSGPNVRVEPIKDAAGKDAVKLDNGAGRTQTWVATGEAGKFALQPSATDGSSPSAYMNMSTVPPTVEGYTFNKQEANGQMSSVRTDKNGYPTGITQSDGTELALKWGANGGRQVLLGIKTVKGADGVDIRRNDDGSYTQTVGGQERQLVAVQVGNLRSGNGAALGDISLVAKQPQPCLPAEQAAGQPQSSRDGGSVATRLQGELLRTDGSVVVKPLDFQAVGPDQSTAGVHAGFAARAERATAVVTAKALLDRDNSATVIGAVGKDRAPLLKLAELQAVGENVDSVKRPAGNDGATAATGEVALRPGQQGAIERALQRAAIEQFKQTGDPKWQQMAADASKLIQQNFADNKVVATKDVITAGSPAVGQAGGPAGGPANPAIPAPEGAPPTTARLRSDVIADYIDGRSGNKLGKSDLPQKGAEGIPPKTTDVSSDRPAEVSAEITANRQLSILDMARNRLQPTLTSTVADGSPAAKGKESTVGVSGDVPDKPTTITPIVTKPEDSRPGPVVPVTVAPVETRASNPVINNDAPQPPVPVNSRLRLDLAAIDDKREKASLNHPAEPVLPTPSIVPEVARVVPVTPRPPEINPTTPASIAPPLSGESNKVMPTQAAPPLTDATRAAPVVAPTADVTKVVTQPTLPVDAFTNRITPETRNEIASRWEAIKHSTAAEIPGAADRLQVKTNDIGTKLDNTIATKLAQDAATGVPLGNVVRDRPSEPSQPGHKVSDSVLLPNSSPVEKINDRIKTVTDLIAATENSGAARQLSQVRDNLIELQAQQIRQQVASNSVGLDGSTGSARTGQPPSANTGTLMNKDAGDGGGITSLRTKDGPIIVGGKEISVGKDGLLPAGVGATLREGATLRDANGREIVIGRDAQVVSRDGRDFLVSKDGREIVLNKEGTVTRIDGLSGRSENKVGDAGSAKVDATGRSVVDGSALGKVDAARPGELGKAIDAGGIRSDGAIVIGRDGRPVEVGARSDGRVVSDPSAKSPADGGLIVAKPDGKSIDKFAAATEGTTKASTPGTMASGGGANVVFVVGKDAGKTGDVQSANVKDAGSVVTTNSGSILGAGMQTGTTSTTAGTTTGAGSKDPAATGGAGVPGAPGTGVPMQAVNLPGVNITGAGGTTASGQTVGGQPATPVGGVTGTTVATGAAGATVATAATGAAGTTVATGAAGTTVATGAAGAAGATGATGATGAPGAAGAAGATGTTTTAGGVTDPSSSTSGTNSGTTATGAIIIVSTGVASSGTVGTTPVSAQVGVTIGGVQVVVVGGSGSSVAVGTGTSGVTVTGGTVVVENSTPVAGVGTSVSIGAGTGTAGTKPMKPEDEITLEVDLGGVTIIVERDGDVSVVPGGGIDSPGEPTVVVPVTGTSNPTVPTVPVSSGNGVLINFSPDDSPINIGTSIGYDGGLNVGASFTVGPIRVDTSTDSTSNTISTSNSISTSNIGGTSFADPSPSITQPLPSVQPITTTPIPDPYVFVPQGNSVVLSTTPQISYTPLTTSIDSGTAVPQTPSNFSNPFPNDPGLFPQPTSPTPLVADPYIAQRQPQPLSASTSQAQPDPTASPNPSSQSASQDPNAGPKPSSQSPASSDPYAAQQPQQKTPNTVQSDPPPRKQDPSSAPQSVPSGSDPYNGQNSNPNSTPAGATDPYVAASNTKDDSSAEQSINEFMASQQAQQNSIADTEGRIEVAYMNARNEADWRVETAQTAAELQLKEEDQQRRRQEDEEERERENKAKRFADAMMTAMATKKQQDQINTARLVEEQNILLQEQRMKYVVLKGDTLEGIAQKKLRDRTLAPLLYEINKKLIPVILEGTRQLLQLRPRLIMLLPTKLEVRRYKSRLFGRQNTKFEYDTTVVDIPDASSRLVNPGLVRAESTLVPWISGARTTAPNPPVSRTSGPNVDSEITDATSQKRRDNVEALLGPLRSKSSAVEPDGRIRYVIRLGDTMRSVAMRHPALKDLTLWRLLAEVNSLSTQTDDKGNPIAVLKRGETIVLPSALEIVRFREQLKIEPRRSVSTNPTATIGGVRSTGDARTSGQVEIVFKPCPQCNRFTSMSATICPSCAFPFARRADGAQPESESQSTVVVSIPQSDSTDDATTSLLLAAGLKPLNQRLPEPKPSDDRGTRNVIAAISESCRIVSFGNMDDTGAGFRTRLEVSQQDFWLPVVRYEINEDSSWRHTFNLSGTRKTTRLDLPSRQAKELAENDLTSNAEKYCEAFLAGSDINDIL